MKVANAIPKEVFEIAYQATTVMKEYCLSMVQVSRSLLMDGITHMDGMNNFDSDVDANDEAKIVTKAAIDVFILQIGQN